jgi:hypothetical protein
VNRIILIGNGFDLAHGLKTSYADFIDWYWGEWGKRLLHGGSRLEEDGLVSFKLNDKISGISWASIWGWYVRRNNPFEPWDENEILKLAKNNRELCDYVITSPVLEELCMQLKERKWVDIENVYFKHLSNDFEEPEKVNFELSVIRNRLIDYLKEVQDSCPKELVKANIKKMMLAPFEKSDFAINAMDSWKSMLQRRVDCPNEVLLGLISSYLNQDRVWIECNRIESFYRDNSERIKSNGIESIEESRIPRGFFLPDRVLMLSFNYTNIADSYFPHVDRLSVNHIHGELSNPESVIFGYGDEMDENYKKLSNKNDNEYLNNIKSIKYLESPNYRNLLDFIESDTYQVYIMGHSCGNSDRTLLNTLFEHKNCVSIKPFYYIRKDGTDNYMELVQNISRNFTDMKLMRDRVVNKTFCEAYSDARTYL